jgi:hypothetical protein
MQWVASAVANRVRARRVACSGAQTYTCVGDAVSMTLEHADAMPAQLAMAAYEQHTSKNRRAVMAGRAADGRVGSCARLRDQAVAW